MSFAIFAMLLFMLIRSSSMFEFHMLVAAYVMLNILELIMELLPNFPTAFSSVDAGHHILVLMSGSCLLTL